MLLPLFYSNFFVVLTTITTRITEQSEYILEAKLLSSEHARRVMPYHKQLFNQLDRAQPSIIASSSRAWMSIPNQLPV
jgi:hypothetical protein